MSNYLFVYGKLRSNIRTDITDQIKLLDCTFRDGKIYGYKLFIDKENNPIIQKTVNSNDYVIGELIQCDNNKFNKLIEIIDKFSDCPTLYKKHFVIITIGNDQIHGFTYFPNKIQKYYECEYNDYTEFIKNKININN